MNINLDKVKSSKTTKELLEFSIINIDKPTGPTSFTVSQFIKKSLNLKKTSHLGTLDPAVTGVLPVALNRACRLNEYLMHRDKKYVGIMRIHKENISDPEIKKQMKNLTGKITQLPPKRSAVKRAPRQRTVKTFNMIERDGKDILFEAEVEAGTYIRTLCVDLGKKIGGAHMLELRRTRAGIINEEDSKYPSIRLYNFEEAIKDEESLRRILIPGEIIATILPSLKIKKEVLKKVLTGSPIFPTFLEPNQKFSAKKNDKICIFQDDKFIGVYNYIGSDNLTAKPEFVKN